MSARKILDTKDRTVTGLAARALRGALVASAAAGLLAAAVPSRAEPVNPTGPLACSKRTLKGDYGVDIDGTILAGPAALLLRGVATTHFDGRGGLTQLDFVTINGAPEGSDWRPGSGTYAINADCTGTAVINFEDGSPSLSLRVVVFDSGKQFFTIVEGNPTGSRGFKIR